jgi:hypothetical protein
MPYCRKCGTSLDEAAQFCSACGPQAGEGIAATPAPPSPQPPVAATPTQNPGVGAAGFVCLLVGLLVLSAAVARIRTPARAAAAGTPVSTAALGF